MYRDHTQVDRIKEKSDPNYGVLHLISMHAKRLESGWIEPFVKKEPCIELDYGWEQAQRLGIELNRNAMICDLHQTRIYKKVLRKGSFKLNFNTEISNW